jgi:glycosyltransferase involved in cell wall biosynthesis
LKILLVNYEYPPLGGGAANATMFIGKVLAELGHEPTVLTSAFGNLSRQSFDNGIDVRRIRAFRKAADRSNPLEMASFLVAALWHARRVARERQIEGVITFFTIPCGPVGWFLKRSLGLPYIASLRGGDVPGLVPGIDWMHRLTAPLRRTVLRHACAVVANSASLARLSERTDPFPVRIIPNGVNADYFRPASDRERRDGQTFRILFVGRLHAEKNVALLLRAVAGMRSEAVTQVHLDIVGDGRERVELERLAGVLGLSACIAWHGWRSKEETAVHYRHSDCLVNPSMYEGMPNTVLEAMASGLAVVASDVGGNNELVIPGETGFLFRLSEPHALQAHLKTLAGSRELCRSLGARGREVALAGYSWTSVGRRYVSLLSGHDDAQG